MNFLFQLGDVLTKYICDVGEYKQVKCMENIT